MNKLLKKWGLFLIVFLLLAGMYITLYKPRLFSGKSPEPKFINYDAVSLPVQPSIVKISNSGYGVIVNPRGYVLIVSEGMQDKPRTPGVLAASYSGKSCNSEVLRLDKRSGLAILKLMTEPAPGEFVPVRCADSSRLKQGDVLLVPFENGTVAGKALKLNQTLEIPADPLDLPANEASTIQTPDLRPNANTSLQPGQNTAPATAPQQVETRKSVIKNYPGLITSDINLGQECNGLPVLNQAGDVVGLTLLAPLAAKPENTPGNVYIIPISRAKPLLAHMSRFIPEVTYTKESRTKINWLGAAFLPQAEIGGSSLLVTEISQDSPWAKTGIKPGDKISDIGGSRITGLLDLEKNLPALVSCRKVSFSFVRSGKIKTGAIQLRKSSFRQNKTIWPAVFVVLVLCGIYYLIYLDKLDRTVIFVAGAVFTVACGYYLDFYTLEEAWDSLKARWDVICFIIGLNIITVVLDEAGLFDTLAKRIVPRTGNSKWKIMLYFCLLTYTVSLFINNLTTIMVIIPMIFALSRCLEFDPKPFLVGMIVASNLGGASTMVGDFPNILISSEAGIGFSKFLIYMLPLCLLELAVLLIYLRISQRDIFVSKKNRPSSDVFDELPQLTPEKPGTKQRVDALPVPDTASNTPVFRNPGAVKRGLLILVITVIGFFVCEFAGIAPALIALAGGLSCLVLCRLRAADVLERLNYRDILFFSGLFILVGAAEASGLLSWFSEIVVHLSFGSLLVRCLLLMWVAGLITAFLNAGPSAAFLLPMVMSFKTPAPDYLYFWALSLGILAGSSATLTGATAGSVSASMLSDFLSFEKAGYSPLSFRYYSRIGLPISLIFLLISSVYVVLIYRGVI